MPQITIGFGIALIAVGVGGVIGFETGTAGIPAIPGVILLICGLIGLKPAARKHAMHAAAAFALLGLLLPLGMLIPQIIRWDFPRPAATTMMALMALLTGAYLVFSIRSFIEARRAREAPTQER